MNSGLYAKYCLSVLCIKHFAKFTGKHLNQGLFQEHLQQQNTEITSKSHETLRKLCLSIKFPDQKIKRKFILRSVILQNPSRRLLLREVYMSLTCTQFFYFLILIFNNKSQRVKPLATGHKIAILTECVPVQKSAKAATRGVHRCFPVNSVKFLRAPHRRPLVVASRSDMLSFPKINFH